jgi:hypothetical protein
LPLRACIKARRFSIAKAKITVDKKRVLRVTSPPSFGFKSHTKLYVSYLRFLKVNFVFARYSHATNDSAISRKCNKQHIIKE